MGSAERSERAGRPGPVRVRRGLQIGPGTGPAGDVVVTYGPYGGRGPRGYQRPDPSIHDEVCDRLTRAGDLDASDVEVSVSEGLVTLGGTVGDRREKWLAEDLALAVSGVRDVVNDLRPRRATAR